MQKTQKFQVYDEEYSITTDADGITLIEASSPVTGLLAITTIAVEYAKRPIKPTESAIAYNEQAVRWINLLNGYTKSIANKIEESGVTPEIQAELLDVLQTNKDFERDLLACGYKIIICL